VTGIQHTPAAPGTWALVRKVDAAAWGLFFIWIGVALLAGLTWGIGLLGVGIITLGTQLARKSFGLGIEGFWIAVGLIFLAGGVWELLSVRIGLVPIVLIVAGVALLLSAVRRAKA
jgi:uncharacterized membrane protein